MGPVSAGSHRLVDDCRRLPPEQVTTVERVDMLTAGLVEWMMGYPSGWVTDVVSRNQAFRLCGNGVVSRQASGALAFLLARPSLF